MHQVVTHYVSLWSKKRKIISDFTGLLGSQMQTENQVLSLGMMRHY